MLADRPRRRQPRGLRHRVLDVAPFLRARHFAEVRGQIGLRQRRRAARRSRTRTAAPQPRLRPHRIDARGPGIRRVRLRARDPRRRRQPRRRGRMEVGGHQNHGRPGRPLGGLPCPQGRRGHARPRQDGLHLDLPRRAGGLGRAVRPGCGQHREGRQGIALLHRPARRRRLVDRHIPRLQAHPRAPLRQEARPSLQAGAARFHDVGRAGLPRRQAAHRRHAAWKRVGQPSRGPSRLVRDRERLRRQRAQLRQAEERVAAQARGAQGRQGQRPQGRRGGQGPARPPKKQRPRQTAPMRAKPRRRRWAAPHWPAPPSRRGGLLAGWALQPSSAA